MSAEMLTLPELAEHLGCSVRTLHRRRTAAGPSAPHGTRMGRRLHFPRTAVESWAGEHLAGTRARSDGLTGVLLDHVVEPGSPEWLTRMSASKIAAVVGLSPYESRFSLWHRMAGLTDGQLESDEMRRGHYLEPAIAAWFGDQHPEYRIESTGTWVAADAEWQAASPDRLCVAGDLPTALLQCKSAADTDYYGPSGSDEIPPGYHAQVTWEMLVTGARVCYLAVLLPYLEFREYVIAYDQAEAEQLVTAAAEFMASLPNGSAPRRPSLDDHAATYQAVRELHPDIDGSDAPITAELAAEYLASKADERAAKARAQGATTAVLDAMGTAKTALTQDGQKVAIRVPGRGDNPPSLRACKQPQTNQRAA